MATILSNLSFPTKMKAEGETALEVKKNTMGSGGWRERESR